MLSPISHYNTFIPTTPPFLLPTTSVAMFLISGSRGARHAEVFLLLLLVVVARAEKTLQRFPTVLVFGDSSVDTGNNNYIPTPFKGNHPPYGLDFPGSVPTGRFSNGKLVPDMLASMMGLKETIPPFLAPNLSDVEILTGVSFASAGSGYDELTTTFSLVIPMLKQLGYLKEYIKRVEGIVGLEEAKRITASALVIVSAGTNDFIFNFYDIPTRRIWFPTVEKYQDFIQDNLQDFVKKLHSLGCRKLIVSGLPPIGCLPIQIMTRSPILRNCIHRENADARSYNDKLKKLLERMEANLTGIKILYADAYNPLMDIIDNSQKYGYVESKRGCCGTGLLESGPLCTRITPVCSHPSRYVFWDSIHPSESTYKILSEKLIESLSNSPLVML